MAVVIAQIASNFFLGPGLLREGMESEAKDGSPEDVLEFQVLPPAHSHLPHTLLLGLGSLSFHFYHPP